MNASEKLPEGKPPFFKTWRGMYALVLGALVFQIILYYAITRFFE
jgi:hypothetical protein